MSEERPEAVQWLDDEIDRLARLPWDDLAGLVGTSERRPLETASGQSLDLEARLAWDDPANHDHLLVTINVWDEGARAGPTEVAHDEFVLSRDGHGGVVGPVRRMEVVPGSRASRHARGRVIAPGRRFGPYDVGALILGVVLAWSLAADNHFDAFWIVFAWIVTVAALVGFLRRLFRI